MQLAQRPEHGQDPVHESCSFTEHSLCWNWGQRWGHGLHPCGCIVTKRRQTNGQMRTAQGPGHCVPEGTRGLGSTEGVPQPAEGRNIKGSVSEEEVALELPRQSPRAPLLLPSAAFAAAKK